MASTTETRDSQQRTGDLYDYALATSAKTVKGCFVIVTSAGLAKDGADTASHFFGGVAEDNTDQAAGDTTVRVWRRGIFNFATTGSAATLGAKVCISDNQTVAGAADTTNDIICGTVVKVIGSTVDIDIALR